MIVGLVRKFRWKRNIRTEYRFGSYYKMVEMFRQVEEVSGKKDKIAVIRTYKDKLHPDDKVQFQKLMMWYARKQPIRISSKTITKYYNNQYEKINGQPYSSQQNLMRKIGDKNTESQLSIYDVNIFLKYLSCLEGKGAQKQKNKKVIELGQNISVLEGQFLLKLIERRLTIGASIKTFTKAIIEEIPKDETLEQQ